MTYVIKKETHDNINETLEYIVRHNVTLIISTECPRIYEYLNIYNKPS